MDLLYPLSSKQNILIGIESYSQLLTLNYAGQSQFINIR
jgi:hypothetical protein